jgi:hypothetical protein
MGLIVLAVLACAAAVKADVAPDRSREIRVNVSFVTKDDLSDYRFFLKNSDFETGTEQIAGEIKIVKNVPALFPAGAQKCKDTGCALAAVLKSSFKEPMPVLPKGILTWENFKQKLKTNAEGEVEGLIEFEESIDYFVRVDERSFRRSLSRTYTIKRKWNTLVLTEKIVAGLESEEPNDIKTVMGGLFLSLAFILGGVFIFRKKLKTND